MTDEFTERVEAFHETLEEESHEDYLAARAEDVMGSELPIDKFEEMPSEARAEYARVVAERNRLFWSSFLSEEAGEVASALNDGEPPENFKEEVVDVNIITHAIADVFDFDMLEAFHEKMDKNEQKPKTQEGTGKLPSEARDDWEGNDD